MVRRFIIQVLKFAVALVIYNVLMLGINLYLIKKSDLGITSATLIMGDSYTQTGIDENVISARNISQSAEPYYISYWKLKHILKYYTPDSLILGYSYQNISTYNDIKLKDDRWSYELFDRNHAVFTQELFNSDLPVNWTQFFKVFYKNMCSYPKRDHNTFLGEYEAYEAHDLSKYQEAINRHYYTDGMDAGISEICVRYFNRIVDLCKEKDIQLVLVSMPTHPLYSQGVPDEFRTTLDSMSSSIASNILQLDYSGVELHDSCFLNSNHLNRYGAELISAKLSSDLDQLNK